MMGTCESNPSDLAGKNLLDRRAIGDPMGPKPEAGGVTRSGWTGSDIVAEDVQVREKMAHKVAQPDQHRMLTNGAGDGCGEAVTRKLLLGDGWKIMRITRFSWIKKAMIGGYGRGRVAGNSVPQPQVYRIFQPGTRPWDGRTSFDYAIRRETWQDKTLGLTGIPRS